MNDKVFLTIMTLEEEKTCRAKKNIKKHKERFYEKKSKEFQ